MKKAIRLLACLALAVAFVRCSVGYEDEHQAAVESQSQALIGATTGSTTTGTTADPASAKSKDGGTRQTDYLKYELENILISN
jgi:hypothetical protein